MQYKFFTIPAIGGDWAWAEEELNAFLRSHRVLTVQRELANNGSQNCCWSFCVEYMDGEQTTGKDRWEKREKVDYRTILNDEEFSRFRIYRDIRKKLSEEEAIPAYAIMVDEQLAELARQSSVDESTLKKLKGFGEKKFEKYGVRFLQEVEAWKDEKDRQSD